MKTFRHGMLAVGAVAIVLLAGVPPQALAHGGHHDLVRKSAPAKGGEFTLQSAAGAVSLSGMRGKVVAIYFSYLGCPDICPVYLAAVAQALKTLPAADAGRVQPLFITLDPERDSAQSLAEYAAAFHPSMIGLTGTPAGIAGVAKAYGVLSKRHPAKGGGYAIDHSSMLMVVGADGRLLERLPHDASVQRIAGAFKRALNPY
jgi:protein SCO1/2